VRRLGSLIGILALLVVGLSTPGGQRVSAQEATPGACPTTTAEENAALITELDADLDAGQDGSDLFADDFVIHLASGEDIPGTSLNWRADRLADYPNLTVTQDLVVAQDDLVAIHAIFSGTQQGADERMGVPATGKDAEWASTVFFRIACGKIAEMWPVSDNLGLLMDLGVITEEELQSAESAATPTP
jgi:predicted ester cyclase